MKKAEKTADIEILEVERGGLQFNVLGLTPIIFNRMSNKARQTLLLPGVRETKAQMSRRPKHDPLEEFKSSPYTLNSGPTLLGILPTSFKKSLMTAALDIPGAKKAQIGRLVYVEETYIPIYGIPELMMAITRSADINHTPDIRTRAVVPKWAAIVKINFAKPMLNEKSIINLFAAAGLFAGVGDWRPEKGSGNFGQFKVVSYDDPEFTEIIKNGGRMAQMKAMQAPNCFDQETEELLSWFDIEAVKRGFKGERKEVA